VLSVPIKELINSRFGRVVEDRDCFELGVHVSKLTHSPLSEDRLRQLLGFAKSTLRIETHELDTIAQYIGYVDWTQIPSEIHCYCVNTETYYAEKKYWRKQFLIWKMIKSWGLLLVAAAIITYVVMRN
jgi:hypothetical protein